MERQCQGCPEADSTVEAYDVLFDGHEAWEQVLYCSECAWLADRNFNGETRAIVKAEPRTLLDWHLRFVTLQVHRNPVPEPAYFRGMRLNVPRGWFAGVLVGVGRTRLTAAYHHDEVRALLGRV